MATFTGTVRFNDLEGGFYELHTDKGDTYRLSKCSAKAGDRVKVKGKLERRRLRHPHERPQPRGREHREGLSSAPPGAIRSSTR
jgi:hypothetical protein